MKICILSRERNNYSSKRLREACAARGHKVKVLDTLKFGICVEEEAPDLIYRQKYLSTYDAVIPRIGASISFFGTAVVRQFEQMGVYCLNSSYGIQASRDKLRSMQTLSRHDIGIPDSTFVRDKKDVLKAIELVGGVPVVIKLLEGTQGVGVILAETQKVAEAIIETLHSANINVLIQKFVAESKGRDIRAIVIGDQVVGAMRRVAQGQEFRSNIHRGGTAEPVELDPEYANTAIRAAQIVGLRFAGVDMLEGEDGPKIMEVNSSPGLEGIETCTGLDIADKLVAYIEDQFKFKEFDIRHRLSLARGYNVTELPIGENSSLANHALSELELMDHDVVVLQINRNGLVIPNPSGDTIIQGGDLLLCYGKQIALRNVLPSTRPRKKKKSIQKKSKSKKSE